jgi:hypothetical protein
MNGFAYLAVAVAAAALGAAVLAALAVMRLQRRVGELERECSDALAQFRSLAAGAVGQNQHVSRLEEQLGRLRQQLESVASQEGGGATFNQAIRLARRGAGADQIMETCGLSRMEADLVVLLHRESASQGSP